MSQCKPFGGWYPVGGQATIQNDLYYLFCIKKKREKNDILSEKIISPWNQVLTSNSLICFLYTFGNTRDFKNQSIFNFLLNL